ncbi:transcription-repair coupling factor [Sinanaerobacter sp. ZZT-01]|uniref:transcription-repair coupling factor n=1 Tax=Sinanaerobacter sp. ZZT-01 TaxID=3111540 RepID=UPI002D7A10D5|nr:transcription-repair coupling factor [Sinanaerobacter sp. ZZT-01]WRR92216.1 transcription-repair coupling factor [Sinanaerobacter sp. ZZT-01]
MSNQVLNGKFRGLRSLVRNAKGIFNFSGVAESRVAPIVSIVTKERKGQSLIVTSSYGKAKRLAEDLSFFVSKKIYVIPEEEQSFLRYDAKSHQYLEQRLRAVTALLKGEDCIVITPISGALKPMAPKDIFSAYAVKLKIGEEAEVEELKKNLTYMGYERAPFVEAKGQYGIRGGILDIFPLDCQYPCRIEFFDTEIDSIRSFDPLTQRSQDTLEEISIYPAKHMVDIGGDALFELGAKKIEKAYQRQAKRLSEDKKERLLARKDQILECIQTGTNKQLLEAYIPYFYEKLEYIWDYMQSKRTLIADDPDRILEKLEFREGEAKEDFKVLLERGEAVPEDSAIIAGKNLLFSLYKNETVFLFTPFQKQIKGIGQLDGSFQITSKQPPVFNGRMDFLETELMRYVKLGYQVLLSCSTEERNINMRDFLSRCGLEEKVQIVSGQLVSGMEYPEEHLVIISDSDIFVHTKQKRVRKENKNAKPIKVFTDIRKGDFVVHENHGIGKFLGVEQLDIQGSKKDYLKIKYAGEDMLYVPVEQMDIIQKYVGNDGANPRINKLSSGEWKKTKAKAKAAIADMAKELLELSAARQLEKGYAFSTDSPWQKEFEDAFPYEETPDQLRCINEIKKDMEREIPMDRLLCGDVGYGKTEVAARAVFKCVADGKQAAILVPTTILANQHYYTFKNRFGNFPFQIDMLCRFRNERQQDGIVDQIRNGTMDIVVGTHRMLSKDVRFKNLGLLVIDEEQRFGVQHKEILKQLRKNVDVLTLSATPIPRTLHMSLVGIKEMSLIEEPPEERYPVQTYVMEQEDEVIREAIQKELDRGGQVYVVYNRVRGIHRIAELIQSLVPEANVAIGHGQMGEKTLEDVMIDFINGKYNVLIATTIIESGIDIPNVNTILIIDADHFGLSQLYQLRGRVGRSNRMAYAYLLYQKDKVLTEIAEKRLRSIKEFTEFGSGFRIAMRDLEIRGAGNLLGMEQSGHMMQIGYELYCKLVEDAIRELGGDVSQEEEIETSIELEVPAFIPDSYIGDELLKLQMYKKIAFLRDGEEKLEVVDELLDRFGDIPMETSNLIDIALIKSYAGKLGINRIHQEQKKLVFDFEIKNKLTADKMARLVETYGMNLLIYGGVKPSIKYNMASKDKLSETLGFLQKLLG